MIIFRDVLTGKSVVSYFPHIDCLAIIYIALTIQGGKNDVVRKSGIKYHKCRKLR
jgi:hypothetical protein